MRYINFVLLAAIFLAFPPGKSFAQQATQHKAGDIVIEESGAQAPGTGEKVPVDFCTLYVPENRSNPNGKLIEIVFLRFKSTSKNPGLPIVYLEGGPGVSGINSAPGNMFHLFMALRDAGDVIVPDQRGSGRSNRLTCPGSTQDLLGVSLKRDAFLRQLEQEARSCVQALNSKGVDASAYNTDENADDIEANWRECWLTSAFISRRDFIAQIPALYYSLSKDDLSLLTAILSSVAQRTALPATQTTMRCPRGGLL